MLRQFVIIISLCVWTAVAYADPTIQEPNAQDVIIQGIQSGDYAGESIVPLGDFDGSHLANIAVSARNYPVSGHNGFIAIFKGKEAGLPHTLDLSTADIKITGTSFSGLGTLVKSVGYFNNDRLTDFVTIYNTNSEYRPVLVYGDKNMPASFNISDVGTTVNGVQFTGLSINSIAVGDTIGDTKQDITFGTDKGFACTIDGSTIPDRGIMNIANCANGTKFVIDTSSKIQVEIAKMNHGVKKTYVLTNASSGVVFLYFGQASLPQTVNINSAILDGTNGVTVQTVITINAYASYRIGDVDNSTFDSIIIVGDQYPNKHTVARLVGQDTWPASINLNTWLDGKKGGYILGLGRMSGTGNDFLPKFAAANDRNANGVDDFLIADQDSNRIIKQFGRTDWPLNYTITTADQPDNQKITGQYVGSMVASGENLLGGVGCGTDFADLAGTNKGGLTTGEAYIHKQ